MKDQFRRTSLVALAGFALLLAGLLFIAAQMMSRDHLHARWRSLGMGELDAGVNYINFAVILVGAIALFYAAAKTRKDED